MRKILSHLLLPAMLCFSTGLLSQDELPKTSNSRFYFEVKAGYGAPFVAYRTDTPLAELVPAYLSVSPDSTISQTAHFDSSGKGLKLSLQTGVYLSNHLALELGFRYSKSNRVNFARINTPTFQATHDVEPTWFEVNPGLMISTGFDKKISFYSRLAASIPIAGKSKSFVEISDQEGHLATYYIRVYDQLLDLGFPLTEAITQQVESEVSVVAETEGQFSIGFIGAVGCDIKIMDKLNFVAELSFQSLHIKAKETNYLEYTQSSMANGIELISDDINSVSTYLSQTVYLDEINSSSNFHVLNADIDIDAPKEELVFNQVYSNVALFVGVRYAF